MKQEELLNWFNETLLPTLIKNGIFDDEDDETYSFQKCEFETIERGVSSFASAPTFAKLTLNTPNGLQVTRDIIIKFQCQDPIFRENMKLVSQFQNEVTMYNKVLPAFGDFLAHCQQDQSFIENLVPKYFFGMHKSEDPDKSILIMKDLRSDGYRLSTSVTELDLEHCLVAVEKVAQFHAISFAMKIQKWERFDELKESFVDVWLENNERSRKQCEDFKGCCSQRGINYLISQTNSEVPMQYLEKLKQILKPTGLFDFLKSLYSPQEPLSVICHGDFNRNNVLYRYDNGKVVDAKLIDFQTFLYGSPCLDLSFFIYMNTTLEFRQERFDEIFNHYHSVLIKTISQIVKESRENIAEKLPLEEFKKEFGRVAITAYVIVAFFLPIMMAPGAGADFEEDIKEKTFKELALKNCVQGGDVVSQRVADVIVDFYRRKFYT